MGKNIVYISDEDLASILPGYLKKRLAELPVLEQHFADKNYPAAKSIAHNIKGTALSYGLEQAGEIATKIEDALKVNDPKTAHVQFIALKAYFDNLEVVYT